MIQQVLARHFYSGKIDYELVKESVEVPMIVLGHCVNTSLGIGRGRRLFSHPQERTRHICKGLTSPRYRQHRYTSDVQI